MKRNFLFAFVFGVLVLLSSCPTGATDSSLDGGGGTPQQQLITTTPISWASPELGAAVGELLNKPDNAILPSDVSDLATLDLSNNNISNLDDIVHFPALTSLNLSDNPITNWIPVAHINNVQGRPPHINWIDNGFATAVRTKLERPIGVILPSEVAGVTSLDLSNSNITKIDNIVHFTALTDLNLMNNNISDLTPLAGLSSLTTLDLRGNSGITDWSPVDHVTTVLGRPEPIVWASPAVEAAVRAAINKPTGVIISDMVGDITTLDLSDKGITNLADFVYLVGLTNLNLSNNDISDLSVLTDLTALSTLDLSGNTGITDWTPVAHVLDVTGRPPHITWINGALETAVRDKIERPSGVILTSEVTNIITLDLSNKSITNLANIVHFTSLANLNLSNNQISDISALASLTTLVTLDLMSNSISDISALSGLTNLIALDLMSNDISDISALSNLIDLSALDLRNNPNITDWTPVAHVTTVQGRPAEIIWVNSDVEAAVRIAINRPTGVILTTDVTGITTLDLSNKGITDLSDIAYLTGLTNLNLSNNNISNISALSDLLNLNTLDLSGNSGITDWEPVGHVLDVTGRPPHITWVHDAFEDAVRDHLGKPSGVILTSEVANHTTLDLSSKNIAILDDATHFSALTNLNLSDNSINDLTPLAGLTNLNTLDLSGNSVTNWVHVAHVDTVIGRPPHITWVDNAFEAAVRDKLGRPTGVILPNEVAGITSLDLSNTGVANLADVTYFTALINLNLNGNSITNLTPLASVSTLTNLGLSGNQISNLASLTGLTSLTSLTDLNLNGNSITNLALLASLANLNIVDLRNNSNIINWIPVVHVSTVYGRPSYALKTTFNKHTDEVNSVEINPNGKRLVSGSEDNRIMFWDIDTYNTTPLKNISIGAHVNAAILSSDQRKVVTGDSNSRIKQWRLYGNGFKNFGPNHSAEVLSLASNYTKNKIVSGSADKKVRVWNSKKRKLLKTLGGHTGIVYSVAISNNGTKIASGSADKKIRVWNAASYALLQTLSGHTAGVYSVAFGPNNMIISGSFDKKIKIWGLNDGNYEVAQTLTGHTGGIKSLSISTDGKKIASGSVDKTVKVWVREYE